MMPIHKLTQEQWDLIPDKNKLEYPMLKIHPYVWIGKDDIDYYLYALKMYISDGGKISKEIWNALSQSQKYRLKDMCS